MEPRDDAEPLAQRQPGGEQQCREQSERCVKRPRAEAQRMRTLGERCDRE